MWQSQSHPRQECRDGEGFGDVVITTRAEAGLLRLEVVPHRQEDDRRARQTRKLFPSAQLAADIESAHAWERQVQDQQVGTPGFHGEQRVLSVGGVQHLVAAGTQRVHQCRANARVVIDDQDAHASPLSPITIVTSSFLCIQRFDVLPVAYWHTKVPVRFRLDWNFRGTIARQNDEGIRMTPVRLEPHGNPEG